MLNSPVYFSCSFNLSISQKHPCTYEPEDKWLFSKKYTLHTEKYRTYVHTVKKPHPTVIGQPTPINFTPADMLSRCQAPWYHNAQKWRITRYACVHVREVAVLGEGYRFVGLCDRWHGWIYDLKPCYWSSSRHQSFVELLRQKRSLYHIRFLVRVCVVESFVAL